MILPAWSECIVAFPNCLPLGHMCHHSTFSLIVFELLSLSFSSGRIPLPLALQHGRHLECHSEWPPPHLRKFRWRQTGARLPFCPSPPAFFHCLCKWPKAGSFTNLLKPLPKREKWEFTVWWCGDRISLAGAFSRLDRRLNVFLRCAVELRSSHR